MSRPPHILIWTSSPLCRNPRVVKEATTLGRAGYDVTVLTVASVLRFEEMDRELLREAPYRRIAIDLLGTSATSRVPNLSQRSLTKAARFVCRTFGMETAECLGPARPLLHAALRHEADLTIAHTEIPLWGLRALVRSGRRVAADLEDWYSEDLLAADRTGRPIHLLRAAEAFALQHAAFVSVPSASMASALAGLHGCAAPLVIRNVFPLQPSPPAPGTAGTARPPRFVWFSQTIGPGRGLELFIAAWVRMQMPSTLHLIGDERPGYIDHLRSMLPARRRDDLKVHDLVSPDALPTLLTEFELGLALESNCPPNRNISLTNKIFQYLNAGLGVIATDTAGQREVLREAPTCGLLVPAGETTALAAELDALLSDRHRLHQMRLAGRRAAATQFNWEKESAILLNAVEQALR